MAPLLVRPRRIFGLPGGEIAPGAPADLTVLDLDAPHIIDPAGFFSRGRATPFAGMEVSAAAALTLCRGEIVFQREATP